MRAPNMIALVAALAGCAHEDMSDRRDISRLPSRSCANTAQERTQDAKLMGYGSELLGKIFEGTYADCVRWDAAHRKN
jgi:hypothetical protein